MYPHSRTLPDGDVLYVHTPSRELEVLPLFATNRALLYVCGSIWKLLGRSLPFRIRPIEADPIKEAVQGFVYSDPNKGEPGGLLRAATGYIHAFCIAHGRSAEAILPPGKTAACSRRQ